MTTLHIPKLYTGALDARQCQDYFLPLVADYLTEPQDRKDRGDGVLLSGTAGCGRAWTMAALARTMDRLLARRLDVVWVTVGDLQDHLYHFKQPQYPSREQTFTEVMERCNLLCIEGLGTETTTRDAGAFHGRLLRALRQRLVGRRLTFASTILPLSSSGFTTDLRATYGDSLVACIDELMPYQADVGERKALASARKKVWT